ncbi:MAG: RHS repeat-associated core domain-containing protein, partial [Pseudomonadales bacterium]|nr:RHS repeat-associated core domain-containing protein [Pseudomonadales bacterium]MBP6481534.1 RHS repeat-associated core domain-containing protein [Pseudomonadales bacterium]
HLDDVGLIHMNGRVYDPSLGRMLSPDPVTQSPENAQNYNRYAYVMNNPMRFVDPSGYVAVSCGVGSTGVGCGVGPVMIGCTGESGCNFGINYGWVFDKIGSIFGGGGDCNHICADRRALEQMEGRLSRCSSFNCFLGPLPFGAVFPEGILYDWRVSANEMVNNLRRATGLTTDHPAELDVVGGVDPQMAANVVINVLQDKFQGKYEGSYHIVLADLGDCSAGESCAAGATSIIDRATGVIRLNEHLFSRVSDENLRDFAYAIAHEVLHHNQSIPELLRDVAVPSNPYHDELDTSAFDDVSSVMNVLEEVFGWGT